MWLIFALLNAFFESIFSAFSKMGAQKIDVLSATSFDKPFFPISKSDILDCNYHLITIKYLNYYIIY